MGLVLLDPFHPLNFALLRSTEQQTLNELKDCRPCEMQAINELWA